MHYNRTQIVKLQSDCSIEDVSHETNASYIKTKVHKQLNAYGLLKRYNRLTVLNQL